MRKISVIFDKLNNLIMLTEHFDITGNQVIFEILMPTTDGRYIYYEFINHKITEKHTWKLK